MFRVKNRGFSTHVSVKASKIGFFDKRRSIISVGGAGGEGKASRKRLNKEKLTILNLPQGTNWWTKKYW